MLFRAAIRQGVGRDSLQEGAVFRLYARNPAAPYPNISSPGHWLSYSVAGPVSRNLACNHIANPTTLAASLALGILESVLLPHSRGIRIAGAHQSAMPIKKKDEHGSIISKFSETDEAKRLRERRLSFSETPSGFFERPSNGTSQAWVLLTT